MQIIWINWLNPCDFAAEREKDEGTDAMDCEVFFFPSDFPLYILKPRNICQMLLHLHIAIWVLFIM